MADGIELINGQVSSLISVRQPDVSGQDGSSDEHKKKIAKDFESLLINQLLDEMRKSIGSWGYEKDGSAEQIDGMFWMCLGREMSEKGGIGLWQDIYKTMKESDKHCSPGQLLDNNL
jgi:Rod binding domain-containing protein